jgi:hypothetical protein
MHVERTWRLAQGATLSEVTAHLCRALGIAIRVMPMSDDPVRTRVLTAEGWLDCGWRTPCCKRPTGSAQLSASAAERRLLSADALEPRDDAQCQLNQI